MPTGKPSVFAQSSGNEAERIAAILEEDIVLGLLAPQVRLIEDELMQRFETKRHVVRAACSLLEKTGLVEKKRNIGAMVRRFNREEVCHLYEMRSLLETEAMRRLPLPLPDTSLQALRAIQVEHDQAVEQGDIRRIFRSNHEFHRVLFAHCDNPYLSQTIEEYARRTHAIRFRALLSNERQRQSQQEHHELIRLLEQGEREPLLALTMAHLLPPRDFYLQTEEALNGAHSA